MGMDVEHRKTTLDDDASIYSRTKDTVTKEELKNLPFKQKIAYFKDYYMIGLACLIAAAIFIGYMVYTSLINPSRDVLTVAVLDDTFVSATEEMGASIKEYIGLERRKDYVGVSYFDTNDYQMNMAYMTIAGAGQLDLIVCSYEQFQNQANMGLLADMKELLPAETYNRLKDRMVTGHAVDADLDGNITYVGDELEYGIDITDSAVVKQYITTGADRVILCAFAAPPNKENALKTIDYFLQGIQ